MGKQNNSVTYVSQAKFDKDLNSSVDILIADGADDNTIKEYIQDYKSRFAVAEKKNSVSNGTSEVPQSESPAQQTQKKSLSVGGKPIPTGGSASSVGVSKEDLISKFGFKNKEEQKKAGVEASKVKIDAKTPSAVKPVSVKEDEFTKPEINKAQKETSLFQQKIKREEENAFINDFRNSISIPDNYEQEVRSEIESEISGSGVWNTITQGAKNIWNKVVPYIPGAPSSQSELDQLKADINFLPEAKKEYKESLIQSGVKLSDINDDILTKGAIELEVKKRLEDKKLSLANDYLDSLPSDIKNRIKLNTLNKLGINDIELNKKRNYLLATDKEIDSIKNEISTLEEEFQNNGFFSPESQQKYKDLILYVNNKVDERNEIYKKYEKELSEKTTLEEEFDLFKRSYGFEDKTGRLLNSLADFGIGALQAVNLAKGGPMQDLTATQILGLKLEKDKLANDYLQKQVKEAKNINDFIDYSMDVIISQTPNIALGYMTGGTSMMAGIGVSSFGNTYSNLLQSNLEGKTDYSKSQLYFASGLYGASEALFEKNTLGMIGAGKNLIKKALKNETTKEVVKKSLFNKVVDPIIGLGKDYKGELTEELKTLLGQKITDVVVLDMDSKDVFKNAKEEVISLAKDTGVMTFGLKTFPATFAKILETFATKEHKDILKSNSEKINGLSEILNNESSSELAKLEAKNKIDKLVSENDKATEKLIKDISSLDEVLIKEVVDLQSKSEDLKERANNINSDNSLSIEQKKMLLDDLKSEFIRNQEAIYNIVSGQKTSFDILPEEEQVKFKTQAAEAIIQEQLDKGVERDNIQEPNAEVINKKAIEIYESNKKTTGQVSEQEKPATATEAETTDATQQKTELQSQEKVSTIPKTEKESSIKEDEIIEIPEDELEALRQEVEEQKIEGSLSDNIGQKGYIGSKEGMIKIDDTNQNTIVFETNNEIIELGKADEDSNKSIASFGISKFPQEGVRTEAKKGTSIPVVKIDGKEYEFVSRARDKKGKAVVKLKEKETGLIRRLSGEKAERILKDVALQSDKKEVKLNLKVSGKEVQTQEKTQKELRAEQKKRNSEERRKRREEFQAKTLEELKQEEKKSEELLAKIEEEILDELVKKSKNKDLVKVGQRIFQVTKKQDGTFSVSQVNTEGKLVGIRDEATRNKAIGVFKAKKTKADKKDLEEAQKLIDDFRKDERDRIEKLLDKAINTLDLQGKGAFDASIAIPAYAAKKFLEGIKVSYKAGKTLAEAINDGIKLIRNMGYTTISDFDLKEYALKQLSTKKETKDAVQEQITDEGVLQPKQSEMGLQEMEQGDKVNQEPAEQGEEKVSKVTPIKEVKDQLQDLFSAAKEAVRITKNKAKEINKLKNDLNQFVTANLVGLDASDIGKAAIKSINSAIQKTNDINFEEQAEKINDIIDDLYLRKELKDEKVLDKKIEEMSKDTFYKDKTSSKVTKTKVTDAFKKKIEEAKKNFAKINNPSIADKTAFAIEMNNLYKQGVAERKKVDEAERSRSKENASKLSIFALKKDGRVDDKKRIGLGSKNVDDAFKKGGVIYNGNIYLNTEKGRADFARDTDGLDSVIVNPISTPVTASGSEMVRNQNSGMLRGVSKYIKDLKRRYSTATFSAERFFSPFYTVKGAKEFIENNWDNKLKVYSERIGRQISEFKDVRDEFLSDVLGKELLSKRKWWAKSKTASRIASELAILRAEKSGKDPLSAFVSKNDIRFEVDMLDDTNVLSFQEAIGVFDTKIKEETNPDKAAKLKQQKEEFVNKYIAFEGMTNEGVAALFNMLRQPEGFNKFLNSFSVKDALAIVNYVQDNPKIREIADKSSKMFESIRNYVNPTLDKLGYDTLGESNYISKEDALSAMEGKDTKRTEGFYEMLDIIYPDGIPDKVPYFPLSAEGLSGTNESNVLEFFEDTENPNADYSLLFPSLFTRKSGGNLNLQNLTIESVFDKVSKEAVTMVNGVDIASDLRNLYANEGNNVAMLNAFGRGWNEQFKKKVLNIIKDDAYESALNKNDVVGKGLKVWITSRSLQRAAQLAFNMFSAFSQIFGTGVAYSKGDNLKYLKDTMKNLASTSKRKAEIERLSSAYNAIVNSKNYKERVNKRRDNADVAAVKSVKEKTGFALAGDILSDMLFLTTIADQLSVMSLAPIYAGKYANIDGISEAEKVDEFFAEEVNKTLQSNAPYYTGTVFYNKWSLALGVGGYLQSPRQGMELILNETESILRKEGDYKKRTARIISLMSFSAILPIIFKDVLRGSDDDEEDEKSKADKRTEALQVANKIGDAILESTGLGGSTISAIKNATLIKTSPEIMEMDLSPSDVKASDMIMQLIKGASPNLSITLRNIDNVIDNKGIYSTQDQLAYGIETGVGFPAAQFKKQMDYLSALGSEYYDFYDYFDLVSGKVSQAEFKKFEKEISNLTETLDKVIYPYETKEGALNTSFLNKKQINELSKMSLEQKANYVEEIRLMLINKAVVEQVEMYKKGSDGIDKSKGFYKVRESKFKNELSDMIYDLLKNKYYSEDNAINVEDLKTKLIEFRKDNNISAKSSVDIFKESYKKAEQKMIEEVTIPLIKKVKDYNKGRDRAKFLYDAIGDMQYEDRFRYIKMIGEEFDEETQIEYVNILKNKQERGE